MIFGALLQHMSNVQPKKKRMFRQLLEIAKTEVERVIATDEMTATAWMNQQLEALGIALTKRRT